MLELSKQKTETRNNTKPYSKNKNVLRFQDIFPSKTLKSKEPRNDAGLNSRLKIHELCQPAIIDCMPKMLACRSYAMNIRNFHV